MFPSSALPSISRRSRWRSTPFTSDISERKRAEEQIRYQAGLLQDVSDAIIATDNHNDIQAWNKAAERIYGWKAEETIGKNFHEVLKPEYRYQSREEVVEKLDREGAWSGEIIHHLRNGRQIPVQSTITILKDAAGGRSGLVSVNHDISERKQAEELLRERDQLLKNLSAQVPGMIYTFMRKPDGTYRVPYSSNAIQDIFGISPQEVTPGCRGHIQSDPGGRQGQGSGGHRGFGAHAHVLAGGVPGPAPGAAGALDAGPVRSGQARGREHTLVRLQYRYYRAQGGGRTDPQLIEGKGGAAAGDPPPGQEQPADHLRAADPAGRPGRRQIPGRDFPRKPGPHPLHRPDPRKAVPFAQPGRDRFRRIPARPDRKPVHFARHRPPAASPPHTKWKPSSSPSKRRSPWG